MTDVLERMAAVKAGTATPHEILQEVARVKAEEVLTWWNENQGKNTRGVLTLATPAGETSIGRILYFSDPGHFDGVEIWVGPYENNEPTFRMVNPPMLVEDLNGDISYPVPGTNRVKRFRVDPLQAIAEFIAANSGKGERG